LSVQTNVSSARPGSRLVSLIVVAIGLGLLGGGAAAYYYIVQRPLTWPTTDAVVVSSRVVNPRGPTDHQPEIVFLLASDMREVRTIPSWSSGSYDMVRAYVERFPAGTALSVAVNPVNPSDVRYELGPTFTNLILPGVLGLMGFIFASVGLVTLRQPRTGANAGRGTLRWVSAVFTVIGLTVGGIGAWLFTLETPLSWPTVSAEAVEGTVREVGSSSRGRNSERTYVVQVTFRYTIDGKTITSQTTSGSGFSSRRTAESRLATYAPDARHPLPPRGSQRHPLRCDALQRLCPSRRAGVDGDHLRESGRADAEARSTLEIGAFGALVR
jgi:hypothetical protein